MAQESPKSIMEESDDVPITNAQTNEKKEKSSSNELPSWKSKEKSLSNERHLWKSKSYGILPIYSILLEEVKSWTVLGDDSYTEETDMEILCEDEKSGFPITRITTESRKTCGSCRLDFESVELQQAHFKTELHTCNLKRRMKALPPVNEEDMMNLKESSSSSESEEEMKKPIVRHPMTYFTDGKRMLWVYNNVLFSKDGRNTTLSATEKLLSCRKLVSSPLKWTILLHRGGHFAAAIFEKGNVLMHKAIQRYTTRRKQGGSQSSHDSRGSAAKSAGATLRRHNEAALKEDIHSLLLSWKTDICSSDLIFISAGQFNQSLYDTNLLTKGDLRIRRIPFGTKRPTFTEVKRVYSELGSFHFGPLPTQEIVLHNDHMEKTKLKEDKTENKDSVIQNNDGNKELEKLETSEFYKCCLASDIRRVEQFLFNEKEEINIDETDEEGLTPLHVASERNDLELIKLLLNHNACPSCLDIRLRPPYFVCKTKEARSIFRKYMGSNPTQWDYQKAKIPSPLTDEVSILKKEKEKEKKKRSKLRKKMEKLQLNEELQRKEEEEVKLKELDIAKKICEKCKGIIRGLPFERMEFRYCSTDCVNAHKRDLMREAALKRCCT